MLACGSSGRPFNCRMKGALFESYTDLTWISLGTRNDSTRLHSTNMWIGTLRGFYIPGCRILAAHKTGSEIVSPGRLEHQFPNVSQWPGKVNVKVWPNGWITESSPTKTVKFNFFNMTKQQTCVIGSSVSQICKNVFRMSAWRSASGLRQSPATWCIIVNIQLLTWWSLWTKFCNK